jgi:hypothetical protein
MGIDFYFYFLSTVAQVLASILDFLILDLGFSNFRLLTSNVVRIILYT